MKLRKLAALATAAALTLSSLPLLSVSSLAVIFADDFESGDGGWSGRGDALVEVVDTHSHSGSHSLYVSGRTEFWNGATTSNEALGASGSYQASAWIMFENSAYNSQKFELNLQYEIGGEEKYPTVGSVTCYSGGWAQVTGEITIPNAAKNVQLYIQTAYTPNPTEQDLMSFYIDDVQCTELPPPEIQHGLAGMKDVFSQYFKVGTAATSMEVGTTAADDLITKHFNSITFGNELKPDSVLDYAASAAYFEETGDETNPQVTLASARSLLEYARQYNLPVRGHTLVWHSQTPDWFFKVGYEPNGAWVSKDVMILRMENYIKNVMEALETQYPDVEFYAWDVVNEAMSENGTARPAGSNNQTEGSSAWVQVFGDNSFIEYAFTFARKYAPEGCKLFYNDYNEYIYAKKQGIIATVNALKTKGLIDGVGLQSHLDLYYPSINEYVKALEEYCALGLEVQITELDITVSNSDTGSFEAQAEMYKAIFDKAVELIQNGAEITAIVIWGTVDSTSWRAAKYPLLFDKDYQAKPAYYAIVDDRSVPEAVTGDADGDYDFDADDLLLLKKYNLGQSKFINAKNADMNKDGIIDVLDAVWMKRALMK